MKAQVPEFSKEVIVTSIGVGVVQALDFFANELNLSDKDTQQLWSPFLAATSRMVKPADDMVETFLHLSKTDKVKNAISNEINSPNPEFYATFNESLRSYLKIITESVSEYSYLSAIQNDGLVNKPNMAAELMEMLNYYIEDQNAKGRKIQATDEAFKIVFCTVLPQHVEDTYGGNKLNGVKNTGQIIDYGRVVFSTALLLQIISGMLDS
jgi:hypothetical protein